MHVHTNNTHPCMSHTHNKKEKEAGTHIPDGY